MPFSQKFTIYNTLTRQKEIFQPLFDEGKKDFVGIYSCGPTVYRDPHIGNLKAVCFADMLRSTIRDILGYPVKHVMNLTDVGHLTDDGNDGEDKMEKGARRENKTVWELAEIYIAKFYHCLDSLHVERFDVMPRATDHIKEQIEMIKVLEEKGYTYTIEHDGIYMDTSKVEEYGKLAQLEKQDLKAGARVQNDQKKNITDFALRKFSPKDQKRQMERDSPWGMGFPGRHIECSAMASKYLGTQFDLHTGGVDHIPVHHTNEIAQSECCFDVHPRVKYRMHEQYLNLGGKKLSKSAGGLITLDALEAAGFSGLDLKMLFFTAQYRNFLDYNEEILRQAQTQRKNLKKKLSSQNFPLFEGTAEEVEKQLTTEEGKTFFQKCLSSILDDLNTPKLLAEISTAIRTENEEILGIINWLDIVFFKLELGKKEEKSDLPLEIPENIKTLAEQRFQAKQEKNYALADELRNQIQAEGFQVKDVPGGYEIVNQ